MKPVEISRNTPWVIVGPGRIGRALTLLAGKLGIEVRAVWSRAGTGADVEAVTHLSGEFAELALVATGAAVFLTVTDEAIAEVARAVVPHVGEAAVVVHCSGSLSSDVLVGAGIKPPVAAVHPLLAVADPEDAVERFGSIVWSVEGDEVAREWARGWLGEVGVDPLAVRPGGKILYHASAVASAGLVVGLMDAAFTMAEAAGVSATDARRMLIPLARSALENLESMSTAEALTGPVARGDDQVVALHRRAIAELGDENLLAVYDALTERTQSLAGLD